MNTNKIIKNPLVSIIMPVFNRKHLIERAIVSVQKQSFENWELLIIDDGSTDNLFELLLMENLISDKITYIYQKNRGVALTRNRGIELAQGDFITFLDSDDEYENDHLKIRINYLLENAVIDVVHGGVKLVGSEESHYVQDAFDSTQKIHILDCCIGSTFFGKKEAFVNAGGFKNLPYSAESEFLPRLEANCTVAKIDNPTYIYYTGLEDSICARVKTGSIKLKEDNE